MKIKTFNDDCHKNTTKKGTPVKYMCKKKTVFLKNCFGGRGSF
jgi:hypothetical protein